MDGDEIEATAEQGRGRARESRLGHDQATAALGDPSEFPELRPGWRLLAEFVGDLAELGEAPRRRATGSTGISNGPEADRVENVRRVTEVVRLVVDAGLIANRGVHEPLPGGKVVPRGVASTRSNSGRSSSTPPWEACEAQDLKGAVLRARRRKIRSFTGIGSSYDRGERPKIRLETGARSLEPRLEQVSELLERLEASREPSGRVARCRRRSARPSVTRLRSDIVVAATVRAGASVAAVKMAHGLRRSHDRRALFMCNAMG